MSDHKIWHHFVDSTEEETKRKIIKLLDDARIENYEFNPDEIYRSDISTPGIVFFNEIPPRASCPLLELLSQLKNKSHCRVICVSINAKSAPDDVWKLLQAGAEDVIALTAARNFGDEIAARLEWWQKIDALLESPAVKDKLVGKSPVWIKTLRQIAHIGRFTDASVLITGESGTGKELTARLIHSLDKIRSKYSMVVLDCATVVPELSGSEFFGHERGAFTGALTGREGAFAQANRGTLFLDEIGELPMLLQAALLRVVQERKYKRVGSNLWQETDFRLICATNRDLLEEERLGNFRRDFYHRLATFSCHLPPLRERLEDIPLLARHFLEEIYQGKEPPEIDDVVMDYLIGREYPGNVRELYQLMRRIAYNHVGAGQITPADIPENDRPNFPANQTEWRDNNFELSISRAVTLGVKLKEITRATEETAETAAILQSDGKVSNAAEKLGIDKRTLQMHVKEFKEKLLNGNGSPYP